MSGACADAEVHLAPGAAGAEVLRPPGAGAPCILLIIFYILVTLVEILYTVYPAANRLDTLHPSQLAKFHHILAIPEILIASKIMCILYRMCRCFYTLLQA
jgi:hypothetical protein